MLGALALALPLAWVFVITRRRKGFSQSIVHTLIILPIAVAGIMVVVQNSLALAFGLAGIAALRFRNTLDDTKDAIYLFVATGVGIAAAADQFDVGLALSFLFNATIVVLWWTNYGRTPTQHQGEADAQAAPANAGDPHSRRGTRGDRSTERDSARARGEPGCRTVCSGSSSRAGVQAVGAHRRGARHEWLLDARLCR